MVKEVFTKESAKAAVDHAYMELIAYDDDLEKEGFSYPYSFKDSYRDAMVKRIEELEGFYVSNFSP